MTELAHSGVDQVAIAELKEHPENARRGDVATIAASLKAHGQFSPVVVNRRDETILAGHHVVKALKRLGRKKVAVVYVDVDEATARRILLADNRTQDLASHDDDALLEALEALGSLEGTGYDDADLDELRGITGTGAAPREGAGGAKVADEPGMTAVKIGPYHWKCPDDGFKAWASRLDGLKRREACRRLRAALGVPEPRPSRPEPAEELYAVEQATLTDLSSLVPWPGNARRGDVGAISESLRALGQYRPLVVQTSSRRVLKGNHTLEAARALGWDTVAVVFVDVDDAEAARIVLVDNRSSDLATYDDEALTQLLGQVPDLAGTGWDDEDVARLSEDLDAGRESTKRGVVKARGVAVKIGAWGFRVTAPDWQIFAKTLADRDDYEGTCAELAERLELPDPIHTTAGEPA